MGILLSLACVCLHTGYVEDCVAAVTIYYVAELSILVSGPPSMYNYDTRLQLHRLGSLWGVREHMELRERDAQSIRARAKSGASAGEIGTVS